MKFLHTADLHIGKKLLEHSLLEDQQEILRQIQEIAAEEQVDAIVIAGDVYDRSVPSTEAVELLDDFLTSFINKKIPVLMVSGNHDSPERVGFANQILEKQGLHIAGTEVKELKQVAFTESWGETVFVLMPFVKPAVVGQSSLQTAVETLLSGCPMTCSANRKYVLVTHYFVTGEDGEQPELSDSESDVNVGGLDSVSAGLFSSFDYVALGHIHKPQKVGRGQVYYSGAPLKYSFGEAATDKVVNIVTVSETGVTVEHRTLQPLHEMRCIKGKLSELMNPEVLALSADDKEDYLQVTLTDMEELIDPIGTLRSVYPNVLKLILEKNAPEGAASYEGSVTVEKKSTAVLFGEFYEMLRGEPMDEKRMETVLAAAGKVEGGEA